MVLPSTMATLEACNFLAATLASQEIFFYSNIKMLYFQQALIIRCPGVYPANKCVYLCLGDTAALRHSTGKYLCTDI